MCHVDKSGWADSILSEMADSSEPAEKSPRGEILLFYSLLC